MKLSLFFLGITALLASISMAGVSIPSLNCSVFTTKKGAYLDTYAARFDFRRSSFVGGGDRFDSTSVAVGSSTMSASAFYKKTNTGESLTYMLSLSSKGPGAAELAVQGISAGDMVPGSDFEIVGIVGENNVTVTCAHN